MLKNVSIKNNKKYNKRSFKMNGGLKLNPFKSNEERDKEMQSNKAIHAGMKVLIASLYDTIQNSHEVLIKDKKEDEMLFKIENNKNEASENFKKTPLGKFILDNEPHDDEFSDFFQEDKKDAQDKLKEKLSIYHTFQELLDNLINRDKSTLSNLSGSLTTGKKKRALEYALYKKIKKFLAIFLKEKAVKHNKKEIKNVVKEATEAIFENLKENVKNLPNETLQQIKGEEPKKENQPVQEEKSEDKKEQPQKGGDAKNDMYFNLIYKSLIDHIKTPEAKKNLNIDNLTFDKDDVIVVPNIKDALTKIIGEENKDSIKFRYTDMYKDYVDKDGNFLVGNKLQNLKDGLDTIKDNMKQGIQNTKDEGKRILQIPLNGKFKEESDRQFDAIANSMKYVPNTNEYKTTGMYRALMDGAHKISVASLVRSLEALVYAATNSKELTRGNIKMAFELLQTKLTTLQSFIDDPRGKVAIAKTLEHVVSIGDIILDEIKGPVLTIGGELLEISLEAAEKLFDKTMKFSKNSIRIIPIIGDIFIITENILTIIGTISQTSASFLEAGKVMQKGLTTMNPLKRYNDLKSYAEQFSDNYSKFAIALQADNIGGMIDALSDQAVMALDREKISGGSKKRNPKRSLKIKKKKAPSRKKNNNKIIFNKRKKIKQKKNTRKH